MKKKLFLFAIICIASLLAVSCVESAIEETNENTSTLPEMSEVIFHTSMEEPQTKVSYVGGEGAAPVANWDPGDKLSIFYRGLQGDAFVTQNEEKTASADIKGTLPTNGTVDDSYYYAIYPYRASTNTGGNYYMSGEQQPILRTWLTTTQGNAQANNISTGAVLHAGRTDSNDPHLIMYNLCALFRFKITQSADVRRVTFKGNNDEWLSGPVEFTFDNDGKPTGIKKDTHVTSGQKNVKLTKVDNTPFSKDTWYYLTMIPTKFTKGATITLETTTSKAIRKIKETDGFEISRNECLSSSKLDNNLTYEPAITAKLKMNNAEVSSTTLWPNGTASLSLLSLTGPLGNALLVDTLGLTLEWASSNENVAIVDDNGVVTAVASGQTIITHSGTKDNVTWFSARCTVDVTVANNLIAKPFTVDESGTQVYFASGNLYTPDGGQSFAFNSYQGQLRDTTDWTNKISGERDLLRWEEVATKVVTSEGDTTQIYYPNLSNPSKSYWSINWSTPKTFDGNVWRLLTFEQWDYLINHNGGVAKATVNGIKGLILLPNGFERPDGITVTKGGSKPYSTNIYCGEVWIAMEKAGAVFLPEAGNRNNKGGSSENGHYWSRTLKAGVSNPEALSDLSGGGIRINFSNSNSITTSGTLPQNFYVSARLVRIVPTTNSN